MFRSNLRLTTSWLGVLAMGTSAFLGACGGEMNAERETESPAFALATSVWRHASIPVCWENPDDSATASNNALQRGWVRTSVEETWQRVSRVNFFGWGTCGASSNGIRIRIADEGALVTELGRNLDGVAGGMVLNFTYRNWNTNCQGREEACIKVDSVHEFGHALGFAHEQNRGDTNRVACTDSPQGENGDLQMGPWDANSVMNYCNPTYDNRTWPWVLSDGDVRVVQAFYGGRSGMVVGTGGKCLDVPGFSVANGTPLQQWDCHGGSNQLFALGALAPSFLNRINAHGGKCLRFGGPAPFNPNIEVVSHHTGISIRDMITIGNSPGHSTTTPVTPAPVYAGPQNGDPIRLTTCGQGAEQNFNFNGTEIHGLAGKCVDSSFGRTDNGNEVWMWGCSGNSAQKFSMHYDGTIRGPGGKCLEVANWSLDNDARIQLWDCHGGENQHWYFGEGGALINAHSNKCLDVFDWGTHDGARLTQWDCWGGTNQRFNIRASIVNDNKCLDVAGFNTANGAAVQMWDCHYGVNQQFDYFP